MKVAHIALIFSLFFTACLATNADENKQYKLKNAFKNLSFDNPVDLQHAGDETNRIFVVSQDGLIYVFKEEIYAYGLRNPWRFSFDPVTGWMWADDVGQNSWEEIDIIEKGKNYGWRIMEGNHCYNPSSDCDTLGLTLPIWEYRHEYHGNCSITGGYVYRGTKFSELYGKYIYGDYCSGRIWALSYDGTNTDTNTLLLKEDIEISSFGIDEDNELYICDLNGKVYKLAYKE